MCIIEVYLLKYYIESHLIYMNSFLLELTNCLNRGGKNIFMKKKIFLSSKSTMYCTYNKELCKLLPAFNQLEPSSSYYLV